MSFTYDPSTSLGQVRLIIHDTNEGTQFFEDSEISGMLTFCAGSVRRAAGELLDVMADNQAMVLKLISVMGLSTNGPAVADALRKHADRLRQDWMRDEFMVAFDIAENPATDFALRDYIYNELLRET